jgi:hypothetical protein
LRKKTAKQPTKQVKALSYYKDGSNRNERTKKNTCKPENVLGKIPFYQNQNQIGFPANRQTKGTTKRAALPPQN